MNDRPMSIPGRIMAVMSSLQLTVAALFMLMVLTIWGTLYQADHGLFEAQSRFYQSWGFLAAGWFPVPGGQLVMSVLFMNLTASFIVVAGLRRLSAGYLLTHGGLALMLAGGAVTFMFGDRGQLLLLEGEGSNLASSGHAWEVSVWRRKDPSDARQVQSADLDDLRPGDQLNFPLSGLKLRVEEILAHCEAVPAAANAPATRAGTSGAQSLTPLPLSSEAGDHRPGLLAGATLGTNTVKVILHGADPMPLALDGPDGPVVVSLRRKRMVLPATIQLLDFEKKTYPGSTMARHYSSRVTLRDGDIQRDVLISMNKPLRYGGHTFYQSSYKELPDGREASVLAVVRNRGRLTPYVATFMTFIGMAVHFLGHLARSLAKESAARRART